MELIDWLVLITYIILVIGMSYLIGRKQKNQEDYYLGGRRIGAWQVGSSLMANQVSAISLIGAPAFIAIRAEGGLTWLQYELAVPLAMIFIIAFLVPLFWKTGGITIYTYLERRFGLAARTLVGMIFLVSRSMATGVALLTTSIVTSVCIGLGLPETIIIIGIVSLAYTALGGITADIYSDIIQLIVLWLSSIVCIVILLNLLNGEVAFLGDTSRLTVFDFRSTGLGDGKTFSFWPMLFGGLFLYVSYYGCDQSQAQRLLATKDGAQAGAALLINGIFRFPLVLTYCAVGVLIIPFLVQAPELAREVEAMKPDYLMPLFFVRYIPAGLLGIIVAGIFAASMSSLDSAINSLSASTWQDFLIKIFPSLEDIPDLRKVFYSRGITVFWGVLTTIFAILLSGGTETVIELVNKIGSAFYGPIAAVFFIGIVLRVNQRAALGGFFCGFSVNILLWLFCKEVSWMWWNLTGFFFTFAGALVLSPLVGGTTQQKPAIERAAPAVWRYALYLFLWFVAILLVCLLLEYALPN